MTFLFVPGLWGVLLFHKYCTIIIYVILLQRQHKLKIVWGIIMETVFREVLQKAYLFHGIDEKECAAMIDCW